MRTECIEQHEDHTIFLAEGVDYNAEDLRQDGFTLVGRCLSSERLTEIAKRIGFDKWVWVGTIYPNEQGTYPKELKVILRKKPEPFFTSDERSLVGDAVNKMISEYEEAVDANRNHDPKYAAQCSITLEILESAHDKL